MVLTHRICHRMCEEWKTVTNIGNALVVGIRAGMQQWTNVLALVFAYLCNYCAY